MEFAAAALRNLLPKIAQLLQDEYNLQSGVKKDIEFLTEELKATQVALEEVGEVPLEQLGKQRRIWAQDVRNLSYDMEDIIDTFVVDMKGPDPPSKGRVEKIFKDFKKWVTTVTTRHGIAKKIKDIKERVRDVAERRKRYKVDITPANKTPIDPRIKALYTKETELVGIDEAKEEVITRLTKEDDDYDQKQRIVSIAGFGGLGKTTLAKVVYDEIKGQFDCTAFVSVSRNPDTNQILKNILCYLDKENFNKIPSHMLGEIKYVMDKVIEVLRSKRYLIVIDDIWDREAWDLIRCVLIENNMKSGIITTTRRIDVAEQVGGCYRLKPLSDESSGILFYGRIFGSKDKCPAQFLDVSQKILKKCGGVPLAIMTTSSLLANKSETINEWNHVCGSIGSGLESNNLDMDITRKILLLSYYDLPSHLKTCLLYLSIFPEDSKIGKGRLISRWVAEGFVQAGDKSFLETGESYFNELLNRSLIQPADIDMDGTPRALRVHDTVLDLICFLSKEECFITTAILGDGKKLSLDSKVRMLSLNNTTAWPTMDMPKLRSLTMFSSVEIDSMPSLACYRLLRVLDLQGCELKDLASLGFIGSLSHLRYLGISSSRECDKLPVEIGKLQFLQTLDLSKTWVEELPSSLIGLGQLTCLRGCRSPFISNTRLSFSNTRLPDGVKNLTSLEVVQSTTVTSECIAEELGHLSQLRVLEVKVVLSVLWDSEDKYRAFTKALVGSIGKLNKVESLKIHGISTLDLDGSVGPRDNLRRLGINGATVVPTWIEPASLHVLTSLYLKVYYERRQDIQVLGTLPCLRHLDFTVMFVTKQEGQALERSMVEVGAFPRLVRGEFYTEGRSVLPSIFPPCAMGELKDLMFTVYVKEFYSGECTVGDLALGHLPSLQSMNVIICLEQPHELPQAPGIPSQRDPNYPQEGYNNEVLDSVVRKLKHEAEVHPKRPRIVFHKAGSGLWGPQIFPI